MTDEALLKNRTVRKAIDTRTLLILSIIDLAFGIVSMVITSADWQICSLLASLLSFVWIMKIVISYREDVKSNVSTFIISIIDIFTGAISVALAVYTLQAVVVMISSLKMAKVAVQTSKAVKLAEIGKPFLKKVFPKLSALIVSFCATNTKKRGNVTMAKEKVVKEAKKQSAFATYLKNNPKTICAIICAFIASAGSGAGVTCGFVFGNVTIPLWASIIIGIIIFGGLMAVLCLGVFGAGWESPVAVALRKLIKQLGFGAVLPIVEEAYKVSEKEKAEAEAQALLQEQADHDRYEAEYKIAVMNGNCEMSLDQYIAEKKAEAEAIAKANKERELKAQYINAVQCGDYTGSFVDFCANK